MYTNLTKSVAGLGLCLLFSGTMFGQTITTSQEPVFASAVIIADDRSQIDALLDVNLDGKMDGVGFYVTRASKYLGDLRAFINDGKGNFTVKELLTRQTLVAPITVLPDVVLGDWDGDGNQDFALDKRDGTFVFYVSRKTTGPVLLATRKFKEFTASTGMVAADFNGDKKDDLAVLNGIGVNVYLSSSSGPDALGGNLLEGGTALRLIDINKDGVKDLLIQNGTKIVLAEFTKSTGAWTKWRDGALKIVSRFDSGTTHHPTCGDIDKDGDEDAVLFGTDGNYRVLRQTKPATYSLEKAVVGGPATALADINGDGWLDGICCGGGGGGRANTAASMFEICINNKGVFSKSEHFPNIGARHVAGAADIDGDGRVEIVGGRGVIDANLLNSRQFSFEYKHLATELPWTTNVAVGQNVMEDQDGDGDVDLVVLGDSPLRNDGSGKLRLEAPFATHTYSANVLWGDWDGDNDLDYIVPTAADYSGYKMYLNHNGTMYVDAGAITPKTALRTLYTQLYVVDVNADGRDDLVSDSGYTYLSQGTTTFKTIKHAMMATVLAVKDLNNDGYADIWGYNAGYLSVQLGKSDGTITAPISIFDAWSLGTSKDMHLLDSDNDGDYDMWGTVKNQFVWMENTGSGMVTRVLIPSYTLSTRAVHIIRDLDGNGLVDAALIRDTSLKILLQTKKGVFTYIEQAAPVGAIGMADLDYDGDLDIVGTTMVAGTQFGAAESGVATQYGEGSSGWAGIKPVLGATGPYRVATRSGLSLRAGRGGDLAMLVAGVDRVDLTNYPFGGFNLYVYPTFIHTIVRLDGSNLDLGKGHWRATMILPPATKGLTLYHQAYLLDPTAPAGLISTNGVRIVYGK